MDQFSDFSFRAGSGNGQATFYTGQESDIVESEQPLLYLIVGTSMVGAIREMLDESFSTSQNGR